MLRRIPSSIRGYLNTEPLGFVPSSFFSVYFHSPVIFSSFSASRLCFPPQETSVVPCIRRRSSTPTVSFQVSWFRVSSSEIFNDLLYEKKESLIINGNEMALRAVRNRQQAAASVGPYVRPTVVSIPSKISASGGGAARGGVSSRSLSSQAGASCLDTATFPLQKKYGQHLLRNPGILDKLLVAANINSSDVVLEIGPGTGNLTVRLCPLARLVRAFDIDQRMISEVQRRCNSLGFSNIEIIHGDALRQDLGTFDVCAANLPYQISSPFLFKLLAHKHPFRCAVLMFQEEFGERLLAQPGDPKYCRLAANVNLFAKVFRICKIDRNSFRPPPKVDSVIVKIVPKKEILPVDFREWNGLLRICFSRKRRTLRSIFKRPSVLSFLEKNHKIISSFLHKQPACGTKFKDICLNILNKTKLENKRTVCINTNQFYSLLLEFHKNFIYFHNAAEIQQNLLTDTPQNTLEGIEEMALMDDDEEMSADSDDDEPTENKKKTKK